MNEQAEDDAPTRGTVGQEIFERVEQLMASEQITRTEAFQRISDESGRRAGTVAANYYRVARQRGAPLQRRGRRRNDGRRRKRSTTDASVAVQRATEALTELAEVVRRQEQELAGMREQIDQLEKLKRWMDRNME